MRLSSLPLMMKMDQGLKDILLSAHLSVRYGDKPPVLKNVVLEVRRGEVLGLIGQSGSGKSTLALAILSLLDRKKTQTDGLISFDGVDLLKLREREMRDLRGRKISLVLQSPLSSLNPALKVRTQLNEAWRAHASSQSDCDRVIRKSLDSVSLPSSDEFLAKYPSQMSIGQAQRVLIAMAVMHSPSLMIADEATSALDVITQSEILNLFRDLNRNSGMSILYISHDLASVAGICDRVAILHHGEIVESGPTLKVLTDPRHSYTQRLIASIPRMPAPLSTSQAAGR